MKLIFVPLILATLFIQTKQSYNKCSITIEYSGDQDKPYPVIVFYLPGSEDTVREQFYIHKIQVSKSEFDSIEKLIKSNKDDYNSYILPAALEFRIQNDGQLKSYFLRGKEPIIRVFNDIISIIKEKERDKKLKEPLYQLLRRFGFMAPDTSGYRSYKKE